MIRSEWVCWRKKQNMCLFPFPSYCSPRHSALVSHDAEIKVKPKLRQLTIRAAQLLVVTKADRLAIAAHRALLSRWKTRVRRGGVLLGSFLRRDTTWNSPICTSPWIHSWPSLSCIPRRAHSRYSRHSTVLSLSDRMPRTTSVTSPWRSWRTHLCHATSTWSFCDELTGTERTRLDEARRRDIDNHQKN